jgi:hypothetical protein
VAEVRLVAAFDPLKIEPWAIVMFGKIRLSRWLVGAVILAAAECASVVAVEVSLTDTAQAQFFRDDRYPGRQRSQRSGGGFFGDLFGPSNRRTYEDEPVQQRDREQPSDNSRAPSPRKADKDAPPPTTSIVVMGDGMADWLAYGLEDAFSDSPEIAIIRKNKPRSGLLRYEAKGDLDWWHVARDLLAPEKPNYVIMMLGVSDRQNIREKDLAKEADKKKQDKIDAGKTEAAKTEAAKTDAGGTAEPGKTDPGKADADKTAQNKDAAPDAESDDADQPSIITPERQGRKANGTVEFRTDQWAEVYSRRIDETIAALKSKGVPVFWVGLPSIKGARSTADAVYLNDLYRGRAEKAGAVYIDVWDGFVDEGGKFTTNGPDYEGQMRRLRSGDGVYFTKYGARKLAHYVEREIRRYMSNRSLQISLPSGPVAPLPADGKSAVRPLAGPVLPLTVSPGNSDELAGGAGSGSAHGDAIATQVLVKGEPVAAPTGRADDFSWRHGNDADTTAPQAAVPPVTATPAAAPIDADKKPAESKTPAEKTTQSGGAKPKPQRAEDRPKQRDNAPRPPQPIKPTGPLGWLR